LFFSNHLALEISWIILGVASEDNTVQDKEAAPMKEKVRVVFRVQEVSGGEPWIRLEPLDKNLKNLGIGFLGFELPEGTTINKAEEIAAFLQENINSIFLQVDS
jgi:hypothetical protein